MGYKPYLYRYRYVVIDSYSDNSSGIHMLPFKHTRCLPLQHPLPLFAIVQCLLLPYPIDLKHPLPLICNSTTPAASLSNRVKTPSTPYLQ